MKVESDATLAKVTQLKTDRDAALTRVTQIETKIDNVLDLVDDFTKDKNLISEELTYTKEMLSDEKNKTHEYLARLDWLQGGALSDFGIEKKKVLLLMGCECRDQILPEINQEINQFDLFKDIHSVSDLAVEATQSDFVKKLSEYHQLVIILGTTDIRNGLEGQVVFTKLIQNLRLIKSKVDISIDILLLPTVSAKGKIIYVDMCMK